MSHSLHLHQYCHWFNKPQALPGSELCWDTGCPGNISISPPLHPTSTPSFCPSTAPMHFVLVCVCVYTTTPCVSCVGERRRWVIAHIPPGHNSSPCCWGWGSPGGVGVLSGRTEQSVTSQDVFLLHHSLEKGMALGRRAGGREGGEVATGGGKEREGGSESFIWAFFVLFCFLSLFFLFSPLLKTPTGEDWHETHHSFLSCCNTLKLS